MLKKLIRHEFRATSRIFIPLFAALIFVSLVNRFLFTLRADTPSVIGVTATGFLIAGIAAVTFVFTLQRFRKNLLSDEGYLMMTLPVKTDSLIFSKLIVSAVWCVLSVKVVALSILTMALPGIGFRRAAEMLGRVWSFAVRYIPQTILYGIEFFVLSALMLAAGILLLYACVSLSMFANRRRGLFAFVAFIVISTARQAIMSMFSDMSDALNLRTVLNNFDMRMFGRTQIYILLLIVAETITCAVYYAITRHMLKRRLNLQ